MTEPDWAARSYVLGNLYRRATGYMAPGHDAPMEMSQEPSSPENRARYSAWCAVSLVGDALDEITRLTERVERLEYKLEDLDIDL